MIKTYLNLKSYNKYIVTKHSNLRNRGYPPSTLLDSNPLMIIFYNNVRHNDTICFYCCND